MRVEPLELREVALPPMPSELAEIEQRSDLSGSSLANPSLRVLANKIGVLTT